MACLRAMQVWYQFDPQGSVAHRLDASGKVLSSDLYDAYGNLLKGGDNLDPYGFCAIGGYYTDRETGLILCSYRYYDPAKGRFLTYDPISYNGGDNLYRYCNNKPIVAIDPIGCGVIPGPIPGETPIPPGWNPNDFVWQYPPSESLSPKCKPEWWKLPSDDSPYWERWHFDPGSSAHPNHWDYYKCTKFNAEKERVLDPNPDTFPGEEATASGSQSILIYEEVGGTALLVLVLCLI